MANRGVVMKKVFRFSLKTEEHEELIKMIEDCPKSLRNELFVLALKMLNQYKSTLMFGHNQVISQKNDNSTTEEKGKVEKQPNMSNINITDIFKF